MTNAEYIISEIKKRLINIPNLTADELRLYLEGYAQCQKDIIELIEKMSIMQ